MIVGRVLKENTIPVTNIASGITTNYEGFFIIDDRPWGVPVTIKPEKQYYSFKPDSIVVVPDEAIEIVEFSSAYHGPTVHSISGTALTEGIPASGVFAYLGKDGKTVSYYITEKNGRYAFRDLADGGYTLYFQGYKCDFDPDSLYITVMGTDIEAPAVDAIYHGYTWYTVSGRVCDASGKGMEGVILAVGSWSELWIDLFPLTTGADGVYAFDGKVGAEKNGTFTLTPAKEGCIFHPDSVIVAVPWKDRIMHGGNLIVPDIVAVDYTVFSASEYYPLSPSASWTYKRTANGGAPVEHVVSVTGSVLRDGMMYRTFSPAGPAGIGEYRVDGNGVYGISDGSRAEVFRFGVVPGTLWNVSRTTGLGAYRAVFSGSEDVNVPAGSFDDCAKYELMTLGANTYELWTIWFARGAGMVRQEYTLVNYGEVGEHTLDELRNHTW